MASTGKILAFVAGVFLFTHSSLHAAPSPWQDRLQNLLSSLEARFPGQIGLFVRELNSGAEHSHRGDELWYVASGVKVPIALEVFRQIEAKKISFHTKVPLEEKNCFDSAGETNLQPKGSQLSVQFLLEQMLIHSDNTASDLLLDLVGLDAVNANLQSAVPGFTEITKLSDVRRHAYSAFHKDAWNLKNPELLLLKKAPEKKRIRKLASLLSLPAKNLLPLSLDQAFASYYAQNWNSATLRAYADLLESLFRGQLLGPESTSALLEIMSRVETGKNRVVAGLPKGFIFAHKTGTQHRRICDFGLAWNGAKEPRPVVIATCVRDFASTEKAELVMKAMAQAVSASGVFH